MQSGRKALLRRKTTSRLPGRALAPEAWCSDYVEGAVIDRQPCILNCLLRKPVPCGSLSLFEVHDRNAISAREVIGKANPLFPVLLLPPGEACDPDS
jgi:hypothetical protein